MLRKGILLMAALSSITINVEGCGEGKGSLLESLTPTEVEDAVDAAIDYSEEMGIDLDKAMDELINTTDKFLDEYGNPLENLEESITE